MLRVYTSQSSIAMCSGGVGSTQFYFFPLEGKKPRKLSFVLKYERSKQEDGKRKEKPSRKRQVL